MTTSIQNSLPAPLLAYSIADAPPVASASRRVVASINASLLAAFVGMSLVASSIASMFDGHDSPGAAIVLAGIVAGFALVFIAARRLIALESDDERAASGQRELQ